jgi:hypothetical protein
MKHKIIWENESIEVENARELRVALDLIPAENHSELINQFKDSISEIITNGDEFLLILRKIMGIKGESKRTFLALFGDKLKNVLVEGDILARALALLANDEDQKFLLTTLGEEGIKNCITDYHDIVDCLEWLYGKMDKFFIDLIGWEYIIDHIHTGEDLGLILKFLSGEEEKELLVKMGWERIFECIQTSKDLYYVLIGMDAENEEDLIKKMPQEKFQRILRFKKDIHKLFIHLSPKDSELVKTKLNR